MKHLIPISFFSLFLVNSSFAVNPVPGFYAGIILGGSYAPKAKLNFLRPESSSTPVTCPIGTCTNTIGKLTYAGYGNIGGQIGYRIDSFRVEIEPLLNYNPYQKITVDSTTFSSPKSSSELRFKGSTTTGSVMFNGVWDIYMPRDSSGLGPYIGLGLGYAYVKNQIQFYCNNVTIPCSKVSKSTRSPAIQGIIGANYYLDDFSWFGLDYRYYSTKNITMLGTNAQVHSINLSVNGSFCL